MKAGKLDRRVTLERATTENNSSGEPVETWAEVVTVWAELVPVSARERFSGDAVRASNLYVFRIRHLDGVDSKMRLKFEDRYYRILGVLPIGRMETLELTTELLD